MDNSQFIQSIHDKKKVQVTFFSKEDQSLETRLCAPMDYGPTQRKNAKDLRDKFHLWDYESPDGPHTLSLAAEQIKSIGTTDLSFDPGEFVSWIPKWLVKRNWGIHS